MMIHKLFCHLFTLAIVQAILAHNLTAQRLNGDLKWLQGKWKMKSEHHHNQWEVWQSIENGWEGVGFLIQESDTSVLERLKIIKKDTTVFYVADVAQNEHPVYFKLTKHSPGYWQFENPDHDFPKKIIYRKIEEDQMVCTIEGNGKHKDFYFEKTNY